jgi:polycomb protein EED
VIRPKTRSIHKVLVGHGYDVNDLKVHPIDSNLMFSASKDMSIRLWNIQTSVCIAVFGGEFGHCNEVLSIVRYKVLP